MKTEAERKTILEVATKEIQAIASKYSLTLDAEEGCVVITHCEIGNKDFGIKISIAPF